MRFSLSALLIASLSLLLGLSTTGCGSPSLLITPVANTNTLREVTVQPARGWTDSRIAIIEVEGLLANARAGGLLSPGENKVSLFTQQLDMAATDRRVKAVVLRINSPGGTVTSSDTMYQLVRRFRERTGKPVVASAQEVVASGGYYVALAADEIIVQPTSVVGSIGVIFNSFEFSSTLSKLGISTDAIKSGRFKDIGSPYKRLQPDERALMQQMVDEYFARFTALVDQRRPSIVAGNRAIATDGRVFSGQQAVAIGLADRTGLLPDAIDRARALCGAKKARAILYKRPYGYSGSIYASTSDPSPRADSLTLQLPESVTPLPGGFYYLWEAGR
jgi:protease-4